MSDRRRQLLLLAALVVVFTVMIGRQLLPGLGSGAAPGARRAAGGVGSELLLAGEEEIAELRLDALENKPATYRPGRDPFRFGPAPKRAQPPPEREATRPEPPPQPRPPRAAPTPARPQPPAVRLVYLGSFGLPGRVIAVFSDGQEILNAFEGDVLQTEFVVRRIGYESADIGFVNFPNAPAKRLAVGG